MFGERVNTAAGRGRTGAKWRYNVPEGRRLMDTLGKDSGPLAAERIAEIEARLDVLSVERCSLDSQLRGPEVAFDRMHDAVSILEPFDALGDELGARENLDLVHLAAK